MFVFGRPGLPGTTPENWYSKTKTENSGYQSYQVIIYKSTSTQGAQHT